MERDNKDVGFMVWILDEFLSTTSLFRLETLQSWCITLRIVLRISQMDWLYMFRVSTTRYKIA